MAECEVLSKCPFFNDRMKDMPDVAEVYKKKYCKTDNSACARYMVLKKLGREKVPADLYPNMADKAKAIIEDNER